MQITVSAIGLTGRDLGFIENIFRLAPKLRDECMFLGVERKRSAGRLADVVFVYADHPDAVRQWENLAPSNPHTTPIMVSARPRAPEDGLSLRRPLVLKQVLEMLEHVTDAPSRRMRSGQRSQNALNILVVDDSFPVRKYLETKLHDLVTNPLALDFAANGEEAMLKASKKEYDLVFLDVVMPGIDGYKVCKEIKFKHPAYVVMLTSKKSPFDKVRGALAGADAYITKPPQDRRLQEILQKAFTKHSSPDLCAPRGNVAISA